MKFIFVELYIKVKLLFTFRTYLIKLIIIFKCPCFSLCTLYCACDYVIIISLFIQQNSTIELFKVVQSLFG